MNIFGKHPGISKIKNKKLRFSFLTRKQKFSMMAEKPQRACFFEVFTEVYSRKLTEKYIFLP